ncbi:MAG: glycosyltransferase family 2 protein [Phycisphaerales bacterium]|nr:glycosyltransferase family 2 protein [Phycisphaerales bacterium]
MNNIKVGIIIPDRNDRPLFLNNCLRMIQNQTLQPYQVVLMNDEPITDKCDITWRYRLAYERIQNDVDCVILIENDDWYHPEYIQTMVNQWILNGKPEIIGTNYTIYYHVGINKHFTMNHKRRASAMNTLLKTKLDIKWPVDHEPYTDLHLWKQLNGLTFHPNKIISIGIKHGVGMCGGKNHTCSFYRYINDDSNKQFLKQNMDDESFKFYSNLKQN